MVTKTMEDSRLNKAKQRNNQGKQQQQQQPFNTDRVVRPLLKALGQCHDVRIACKLMEQLHRALFRENSTSIRNGVVISLENEDIDDLSLRPYPKRDNDRDAKQSSKHTILSLQVAKSILRNNGFAVLFVTLQHFGAEATAVTCWACRIFTNVTCVLPKASRHFMALGGLRTLLNAQRDCGIKSYKTYTNMGRAASITMRLEYILKANMVGLLYNLITNVEFESYGKEVATERCLDFVIAVLQTYPANDYVQEWGICYLLAVGEVQDSKVNALLQKKRVGNLFVTALDHFRDDDSNVNKIAREAMQWYASI